MAYVGYFHERPSVGMSMFAIGRSDADFPRLGKDGLDQSRFLDESWEGMVDGVWIEMAMVFVYSSLVQA